MCRAFPYTISDGKTTATANEVITVTPANNAPIAADDDYVVSKNGSITLNPLAGDSDPDGDPLTIIDINGTTLIPNTAQSIVVPNGVVEVAADGTITFTPDTDFTGNIEFDYSISDSNGGMATATATESISVTDSGPVNNPPNATEDSYIVVEDSSVILSPLDGDSDPDGDPLTITEINSEAMPALGTAKDIIIDNGVVSVDGNGVITFTPNANYTGTVTFPYTISDGKTTATANEVITVTPANSDPVAVDDDYVVSKNGSITLNPLAGDSDPDGDSLTITNINGTDLVSGTIQNITVPNGVVEVTANGKIIFKPDTDFTGDIAFDYTISDGNGGTSTATESINVKQVPINQPPVAVDDSYRVNENDTIILNPLAGDSDLDGDKLTITDINDTVLTSGIAQSIPVDNGVVNINPNGIISFIPNKDFTGKVSFPYTISDGKTTATANEIITITPIDVPPTVNNVSDATVIEGAVLEHNVTLSNPSIKAETYTFDLSGVTATDGPDITLLLTSSLVMASLMIQERVLLSFLLG